MNRSLKLSMMLALALGSTPSMALDLGQIQVKSALGQPLLAEIPLHPASPAELQHLTVQLASTEEFARAGIVGGRTTIPLHFSVANSASGQQVIRITSSVAVDDPYLDLLLEVSGSAGKSVREFAILLDPPGSAAAAQAAPAAPVQSPAASRAVRAPASAPAPHASRAPSAPAPRAASAVANGKYGPVQRGQTLSAIAHDTAPSGVDVSQMLLALKQANPDAFYRDNINALKSGVVLRVPTAAQAQAMATAAALAEVRRENSDWRTGSVSKPGTLADAAARGPVSPSTESAPAPVGDRLALVPPKDGSASAAGGGAAEGKGGKAAAALRQDLLRTKESLASLQQQSNDLKTRLQDLTDINSKNAHLLSLKDNEIAQLQSQLAAARKASPVAAGKAEAAPALAASVAKTAMNETPAKLLPVAPAVAATASPAAISGTPAASASAPAAVSPPAAASVRPAVIPPAAKPVVKPASSSPAPVLDEPWYMQTWAWGAGGVAVLALLFGLLARRRKPAAMAKSSSSLAERFGTAPATGAGDDIDQEELLDQLAEHPDDVGLHLELVTLYYSRRDVEHFEAAAEAMHAHITDPQQDEWQDVLHMGEDLVPGHPLFDHHEPLQPDEESEARRVFDIDHYAAESDATAPVTPAPPPVPKKVSEYSFNFDLTSSAAHAAEADRATVSPVAAPPEPEPAVSEPEPSWNFETPSSAHESQDQAHELGEFTDDAVDTKLDLARAYVDMGDADGARAMLGEVLKEGSRVQQDAARRLLDTLH